MVTHEEVRAHFNYNPKTGHLTKKKSGIRVGGPGDKGYRKVKWQDRMYREHRLIWFWVTGGWPDTVDHKNKIPDDNRWDNLRDVPQALNNQNKSAASHSTTGMLGVKTRKEGRFQAAIKVNGKNHHLGTFDTSEEAHEAYKKAKSELHPYWRAVEEIKQTESERLLNQLDLL